MQVPFDDTAYPSDTRFSHSFYNLHDDDGSNLFTLATHFHQYLVIFYRCTRCKIPVALLADQPSFPCHTADPLLSLADVPSLHLSGNSIQKPASCVIK